MLPLLLDVRDRPVLVVGAGPIGGRRAAMVADSGAVVRMVAPEIRTDLDPRITVVRRRYDVDDIAGCWLVFACTDDADLNARIAADAEARQVFCVRADDASGGTARTPAVARSGAVTVAVNGGDDPLRARAIRDAIAAELDLGLLAARPARAAVAGSVALVGGGPGDPELITVRGRRLLGEADVVVVDRLAPRALLDQLDPSVEVIDCGKSPHRHNMTQDEINAVLVERALAGRRVVRLKGGDPFVFGRGAEEVQACVAAGVPVTVVPGVSSVLAAPAAAGIPLTHRGVAADFAVVSGHLDPGRAKDDPVDWAALAAGPATLLLLMAMERLDAISALLIATGRAPHTPVAVVQHATLPHQRVLRGELHEIAALAKAAGVGSPAVVIIGAVAGLPGSP